MLIAEDLSTKRVGPLRAIRADVGRDRPPAFLALRRSSPRSDRASGVVAILAPFEAAQAVCVMGSVRNAATARFLLMGWMDEEWKAAAKASICLLYTSRCV